MGAPLRVLILEDRPADAELMLHELRKAGYDLDWQRVETEDDFRQALNSTLDIILADYNLPQFTGLQALEILSEIDLDIPFIVVTGTIEETALECMRQGAIDYLLKDRLGRLGPAVKKALEERKLRQDSKDAVEALRASEQRYRGVAETALTGLAVVDPEERITFTNPAFTEMLGYNQKELLGMPLSQVIKPEELGTIRKQRDARKGSMSSQYETILKRKDGESRVVIVSANPLTSDDGEYEGAQAVITDITERVRAEEKFKIIFESAPDPYYLSDLKGKFIDGNKAAEKITGYLKEELIGKDFLTLHLLSRNQLHKAAALLAKNALGQPSGPDEFRLVTKDGSEVEVEITTHPVDIEGNTLVLGIARDITERNRASEQIQRQIERLEALRQIDLAITSAMDSEKTLDIFLENLTEQLEIDAASVLLYDSESEKLECASRRGFRTEALRFTSLSLGAGYAGQVARDRQAITLPDLKKTPGKFAGSPDFIQEGFAFYYCEPLIAHDEVLGVIELFHRSSKDPVEEWVNFLEMLATQAAIAIVNASMYSQLAEHSAALETAVENATEELHQSLARQETILNNSPDAILLLNNDGKIEQANEAVEVLFDYSPDELDRSAVGRLLDPTADFNITAELSQLATSTQPTRSAISAIRKDGSSFDAEVILTPIMHVGAPMTFVCTIRDITMWTELQRMKDAFVSNVSHELRTPITTLRLNYSLMKRDPGEPKYLDRFDREITRLNQMIEDLLRLSRLDQGRVELNVEPVDLSDLIAEIVQDRKVLAESHELELVFIPPQDHIPHVQADANLLGQVLSVLLTNAIHYTPAGGHIEVCTVHEERDGANWAGFHVRDDGLGISSNDLPHLFERFYRGRVGRESGAAGTGLGLSIASEIVKRHRGYINVESEGVPGEGTTFTVCLPAIYNSDRSEK